MWARLRAPFCFGGGGAKSEAILIHSICFGYKKNFATIVLQSIWVVFHVRAQKAVLDSLGSPRLIAPRRLFELLLAN